MRTAGCMIEPQSHRLGPPERADAPLAWPYLLHVELSCLCRNQSGSCCKVMPSLGTWRVLPHVSPSPSLLLLLLSSAASLSSSSLWSTTSLVYPHAKQIAMLARTTIAKTRSYKKRRLDISACCRSHSSRTNTNKCVSLPACRAHSRPSSISFSLCQLALPRFVVSMLCSLWTPSRQCARLHRALSLSKQRAAIETKTGIGL